MTTYKELTYKELYDLYLELTNKLKEVEDHIRKVLELERFNDNLQVFFREDEGGLLFVCLEDEEQIEFTHEALILEDDFDKLMSIENKNEMLEFLKKRSF